jgi:hypothetical protein
LQAVADFTDNALMPGKRTQFGMAGLLSLVLVAACVFALSRAISRSYLSGDEWHDVQGLNPDEVRQVLGEPVTIEQTGPTTETGIYSTAFGLMGVEFKNDKAKSGWSD